MNPEHSESFLEAEGLRPFAMRVEQVLLTEDRGQILRRGEFLHTGGTCALGVHGLSPLTVSGSLQVRLTGPEGAPCPHRLARAALRRRLVRLDRPGETALREAREEAQRRKTALQRIEEALARARVRLQRVDAEAAHWALHVQRNVARGLIDPGTLDRDLDAHLARAMASADRILALQGDTEEARRSLDALVALLDRKENPEEKLLCWVELAVDGPAGLLIVDLRSLVPSALWRPSYEARLDTSRGVVDWRLMGTVWQRTGEDWTGVELRLSTARPTLGTRLPPLPEDRLGLREKSAEERRQIQASFQDRDVQRASLSEAGDDVEPLPGVDDGGETRVWCPPGRFDVPADGRPHRVQVESFTSTAESRYRCAPELAEGVFRVVSLRNAAPGPLLAGPTALLVDGEFVGLGEVPFVAAGEPFDLSFGGQDDIGVHLERDREIEKRLALGDLTWYRQRVRLAHMGDAPLTVEVLLRVPVSELAGVSIPISTERLTPGGKGPDEQGHVRWELSLAPGESKEIQCAFRVDRPSNVRVPDPW